MSRFTPPRAPDGRLLPRADVTTPRTSDRRLARPPQVTGVTPEQLARWRAAARIEGLTLAAWIRKSCDAAAPAK